MPRITCRYCGKTFFYESVDTWPDFPFCSRRCRLVDLGKWIEGEYRISEPLGDVGRKNETDRGVDRVKKEESHEGA